MLLSGAFAASHKVARILMGAWMGEGQYRTPMDDVGQQTRCSTCYRTMGVPDRGAIRRGAWCDLSELDLDNALWVARRPSG